MTHSKILRGVIPLAAAFFAATPALAHHPLGGEVPATLVHGLLSGIGHPVIGLDHLAFVLAVGVAAMLTGRLLLVPLAFVSATIAGALVHYGSIGLPLVEVAIVFSVVALGLAIALGRTGSPLMLGAAVAVAGLFHGHAYGEAIVGAEATPLLAYLGGFGLTQWAIAVAAGWAVGRFAPIGTERLAPRLAGAAVFGAGMLIVSQQLLAATGVA